MKKPRIKPDQLELNGRVWKNVGVVPHITKDKRQIELINWQGACTVDKCAHVIEFATPVMPGYDHSTSFHRLYCRVHKYGRGAVKKPGRRAPTRAVFHGSILTLLDQHGPMARHHLTPLLLELHPRPVPGADRRREVIEKAYKHALCAGDIDEREDGLFVIALKLPKAPQPVFESIDDLLG